MVNNKISKILVSIVMTLIIIISIGANTVYAEGKRVSVVTKISMNRYVKNQDGVISQRGAYKIKKGEEHGILQILSVESESQPEKITGNNFYCLDVETGSSWVTNQTDVSVVYNKAYDMVEDKSEIQGLTINEYKRVVSNYYSQLLWILDHMYMDQGSDSDNEKARKQLLSNAGIVWGENAYETTECYHYNSTTEEWPIGFNGYFIDDGGTQIDILLSIEEIQAVQQAAIWYYTNFKAAGQNQDYNTYTTDKHNNVGTWFEFEETNETIKGMKQEQAAILLNYFVDKADEAAANGYTSKKGTVNISYTGSDTDSKIVEDGDKYKVGPLKITTSNAEITGVKVTIGSSSEDVASKQFIDKQTGNVIANVEANKEFYITIPKTEATDAIKITAKASYNEVEKTLLLKEDGEVEQPIVQYEGKEKEVSKSITIPLEKLFDLALRKTITKITNSEGREIQIINENKADATRTITVDESTIPETATYKHRKDPVVVSQGDIVTYQIHIYNEGDIDGYATKIVDQLPKGLQSVLQQGATVTSKTNKNEYTVNYDTTNNKIELVLNKKVEAIKAYDGNGDPDSDIIEISCKINQNALSGGRTKRYLTNIAYISEAEDAEGNKIEQDRKNTESKPSIAPTKTADALNSEDADNYKGDNSNKSVYNDTNNSLYYKGEEDDDDFEKLVIIPKFDLALRKFITKINSTDVTDRVPNITESEITKLSNGNATYDKGTTLAKSHPKDKLKVLKGDKVVYTIRVYNEGDINAKGIVVTDHLPEGLELIPQSESTINTTYGWTNEEGVISSSYLANTVIEAFNKETKKLDYKDLKVECKVSDKATASNLKNIAEITKATDEEGKTIEDIDSEVENVDTNEYNPEAPEGGKGEEDDDDFEDLELGNFDLALRKFIAKTSSNGNFLDNEESSDLTARMPQVDTSKLKNGTANTAIYNHSKKPVELKIGDYVLYTIRVYNEGNIDGYASQITDYLPEYLGFVDSTDEYIKNINDKWTYDSKTRKAVTTEAAANATTLLKAFDSENDDGNGSGLSYVDVQMVCKINKNAVKDKKITNIAEISEYKTKDKIVKEKDIDSKSDDLNYPNEPSTYKDNELDKQYVPGQEDDDDFEKIKIKDFDLALRKFITNISGKDVTTRIPQLEYKDNKIVYKHPKDVVKVVVGDTVIYTLRVFNEGDISGYAEKVSDDIPEYLEYLPENEVNQEYGWVMYDKEGKETSNVKEATKIVTDYLSKAAGEARNEDTLIYGAFLKYSDNNDGTPVRDYKDIQVAFKVKDPNSSKIVITNKAQISEDADEDGNPIDDIDSIPDQWNEGEDDQDYENVSVEYFDLSLLKYVTKTIVTENGKTKTTKTGNTGAKTDIIPKVEVYRKSVYSTTVKFEFTIKVTNEGDIEGYATEITDYVPKGLKFYSEDNKGWKDEGNNVISTKLLKDTLLKPGQSATVKVILRWINGENNLNLKTNIAEISQDKNYRGIPDRDSVPDNKKEGEDDIDDASVILTISTGILENTVAYVSGALIILVVLGLGIFVIKKYVY